MIKIGFGTKNSTFVLFLFVFVGPTLNKKVTMATKKGVSIICKFQNLGKTYLRKATKFQGCGLCRFGVLRH